MKLPGAYLISGPKRGRLIKEGSLIERRWGGGGWVAYSKSCIFDEIHNNFPNFNFPITKTEQETCFVSSFYKCSVIYILTQAENKDELSIESD